MSGADQVTPKFLIIIDFTVENDPNRSILIRDGLVTGTKVNNTEAAHPEGASTVEMITLVVRAAMPDLIAHSLDAGKVSNFMTQQHSGNPTHKSCSLSQTSSYNSYNPMIRRTKKTVEALFHYGGGTRWIRSRFPHAVRILMYHRFPERSRFEAQCEHLRKYYAPVSLTEAVRQLRSGSPISEKLIVVTVDDGYRDFLENALPMLSRYDIPSTVFLTTDLPDYNTWLWVDRVTYGVRKSRVPEIKLNIGGTERWILKPEAQRERSAVAIKEAMKKIPDADRLAVLSRLPELLDVELSLQAPTSHAPLRWDDVRTLVKCGVEFGAHTKTHPILSRLETIEQLQSEIWGSKNRIEEETGLDVKHFCYPNGTNADFTPQAVEVVTNGGFSSAVTGNPGVNRSGANPYEFKRIAVDPNHDDLRFCRLVAGYGISE